MQIESCSFRSMLHSDVAAVLGIERRAYPHPWTEGNFRDCLNSGYYSVILECADQLVGYALMSMAVGEAHILNICVDPGYQRKGLGRTLLRHLEEQAKTKQTDIMLLEVRVSNQKAIALYDSMGFNELGRRKNYYPAGSRREDALIMARQLI